MALREPVAIYTTATNIEAHLLAALLSNAGIDSVTAEDMSLGGLASQIQFHRVIVDKSDVERAGPFLKQYEQQAAERKEKQFAEKLDSNGDIEAASFVVCRRSERIQFLEQVP